MGWWSSVRYDWPCVGLGSARANSLLTHGLVDTYWVWQTISRKHHSSLSFIKCFWYSTPQKKKKKLGTKVWKGTLFHWDETNGDDTIREGVFWTPGSFRDEKYGDVKKSGSTVKGRIAQVRNVRGRFILVPITHCQLPPPPGNNNTYQSVNVCHAQYYGSICN